MINWLTKIGCFFLICCYLTLIAEQRPPLKPTWVVDLARDYGYHPFKDTQFPLWRRQEGTTFLDSERIAVFQVAEKSETTELGHRNRSGGGGRYVLRITVLKAADGRAVKRLDVDTSAELSNVLATHDGRFIIRTGQLLTLYSSNFEKLADITLPSAGVALHEWWDVQVSPSGKQLWLAHHEDFGFAHADAAQVEVQVLNSDDFTKKHSFKFKVLNDWSAGDDFAAAASPETGSGKGILNLDGSWQELNFSLKAACPNSVKALPQHRVAALGCDVLQVFTIGREQLFNVQTNRRKVFSAVSGNGNLMAARIDNREWNGLDSGFNSHPAEIAVYDIPHRSELLSFPVHATSLYFALSANGSLAIIDGAMLTFLGSTSSQPKSNREDGVGD